MIITQVHVRKGALSEAVLATCEASALDEGMVRLAIESFSVTANNITYAVVGDGFRYWDFFPAPEGWGIVPMWGHARVIESRCEGIAVGERVYGCLPMATHLDVLPGKITPGGFADMAAHRQPMSPVYNQYSRLAVDPEHDPAREGERMIFGPLFRTGFLIEYFMRANGWFGASQLVVTSASSKTALGLASVARENSPQIKRIGLTSPKNVSFVESTGLYHEVIAYDATSAIAAQQSVSVDFAGNAALLGQVHKHLGGSLNYSCLVGATHIDARSTLGGGSDMPGPKPVLFFAPDHAVALFREVGVEEATRQIAKAWHGFLKAAEGTITITRLAGLDEARRVFVEMLSGKINPAQGLVIEP
ncbi:MAG: hypothetical protein ABS49_08400 [Erythrobacter sp. SCN 62-14]|nr:MAG: hypothetical protein ABS49_08400 [Erythrobacter sp. SCN 62-14]